MFLLFVVAVVVCLVSVIVWRVCFCCRRVLFCFCIRVSSLLLCVLAVVCVAYPVPVVSLLSLLALFFV